MPKLRDYEKEVLDGKEGRLKQADGNIRTGKPDNWQNRLNLFRFIPYGIADCF